MASLKMETFFTVAAVEAVVDNQALKRMLQSFGGEMVVVVQISQLTAANAQTKRMDGRMEQHNQNDLIRLQGVGQ